MRNLLGDFCLLLGLTAIGVGLYSITPALAWIWGGLVLAGLAVLWAATSRG